MHAVIYRKFLYAFSVLLIVLSFASLWYPGTRLGIDFTGGSVAEFSFPGGRPDIEAATDAVRGAFADTDASVASVQPVGEDTIVIKTSTLTEPQKESMIGALNTLAGEQKPVLERFSSIGPTVGAELRRNALLAIGAVILAIVLFITFAFRHVSEPVSSWKYGLATVVALAHDVIIPTGAYVIFAHFYGVEIDMLFVSALLAILGFSVHDTIVVFDRIREHLKILHEKGMKEDFKTTVGLSIRQTFARSINTSVTTIIVLICLFIFGPDTIKPFTFTLIAGIIAGTYSSIYIASPLIYTFYKLQGERGDRPAKKASK